MKIYMVSASQVDNGWDGIVRTFCPTMKIARIVKRAILNGHANVRWDSGWEGDADGFNPGSVTINEVNRGREASKMGNRELACIAAREPWDYNDGKVVMQPWQVMVELEEPGWTEAEEQAAQDRREARKKKKEEADEERARRKRDELMQMAVYFREKFKGDKAEEEERCES